MLVLLSGPLAASKHPCASIVSAYTRTTALTHNLPYEYQASEVYPHLSIHFQSSGVEFASQVGNTVSLTRHGIRENDRELLFLVWSQESPPEVCPHLSVHFQSSGVEFAFQVGNPVSLTRRGIRENDRGLLFWV